MIETIRRWIAAFDWSCARRRWHRESYRLYEPYSFGSPTLIHSGSTPRRSRPSLACFKAKLPT